MIRCGFAFVLAAVVASAAADERFPFELSPLAGDGSLGALDLAALNPAPAGKNGFVRVPAEHFTDDTGRPLRLFGTNVVADANFPSKDDAPKLARHLAGLGFNIVRVHFLDNEWTEAVLKPGTNEWNREALDRWHFFAAELKKNGIFLNVNLHVGRTYPGTPKEAKTSFSKGLDLFHPPFLEAFRDYSRVLLTTKNPYTGLAPKDDPALAVIEMNNENTLLMDPWWIDGTAEPIASGFRGLWNEHLRRVHGTDEKLIAAYGMTSGEPGPNVAPALAPETWRRDDSAPERSMLKAGDGGRGVKWTILKPGAQPWSHQLSARVPALKNGDRVRLSFRARADRERKVSVSFMMDEAPWSNTGLSDDARVTSEWQEIVREFSAHDVEGHAVRLTFSALNQPGPLELADVSLCVLPPGWLKQGEKLGTVPVPGPSAPEPVRAEFFRFLAATEIAWGTAMKAYLRQELGVKVPIASSHVNFGGLLAARREALVGDFVDNHVYWQHPDFPNRQWDMNDWRIGNTSQVAAKDGGVIAEISALRPPGKPYTVSEYDVPAPSDFAAELWPLAAAAACQQGWAGLYNYSFVNGGGAWRGGKIHGFFDACGHPAKHGLIPFAALVYRLGLVPELGRTTTLTLPSEWRFADATRTNGEVWGSWRRGLKAAGQDGSVTLRAKFQLADGPDVSLVTTGAAETNPVTWDAENVRWTLSTPAACAVTGRVSGQLVAFSAGLEAKFAELPGDGHATLAVVSTDGTPLEKTRRALVFSLRRAENRGMRWNDARTSVGTQWGDGPAEVIAGKVELTLPGAWKASALDAGGIVKSPVTAARAGTTSRLTLEPAHGTMWYLLERE